MKLKISDKLGDFLCYKSCSDGVSLNYEKENNDLMSMIKLLIKQEQDFAIVFDEEKEEDDETP